MDLVAVKKTNKQTNKIRSRALTVHRSLRHVIRRDDDDDDDHDEQRKRTFEHTPRERLPVIRSGTNTSILALTPAPNDNLYRT
mmetsp:Transcript_2502/g.3653  ORF Transcript_2502/g.3653 Transcript_2502/m.3653 type:complete len:83 (+) Transcript_2502:1130-1378(+)